MFVTSLVLGFHIAFVARHNLHQLLVLNGKYVAKFYILRGPFFVDLFAALSFAVQVEARPVLWTKYLAALRDETRVQRDHPGMQLTSRVCCRSP